MEPTSTKPFRPAFGSEYSAGLTTREYMATHILAGLVSGSIDGYNPVESAVRLTDRLIAELNHPKSESA